jgi:hypothetical protein
MNSVPEPPLFWCRDYAALQGAGFNSLIIGSQENFWILPAVQNGLTLKSPGIGTFGGFFPFQTSSSFDEINVSRVGKELKNLFPQSDSLKITLPPRYYLPEYFDSQYRVFGKGKELANWNQHIDLRIWDRSDVDKGCRKKYRQAQEVGCEYELALQEEDITSCIKLLQASRENIGVELSMSSERIRKSMKSMPGRYLMHKISLNGKIVSAAFTVELDPKTLYVLYWGDLIEYRYLSPVVSMAINLVGFGIQKGHETLDLGVSSVNGELSKGLFRFKENLGAISSEKWTVRMSL